MRPLPRILVHAALIAGALLFAFPFAWMVLTSVKQQDEMTPRRLRLLPRAPLPVAASPYVDRSEFPAAAAPGGVPLPAWAALRPELRARLAGRIDAWMDQQPAASPISQLDGEAGRSQLREALLAGASEAIAERLSDRVRSAGAEAAPEAWKAEVFSEADRIVDPDLLARLADACLRSFRLGSVRVRTVDGKSFPLCSPERWTLRTPGSAAGSLLPGADGSAVRYRLDRAARLVLVAGNEAPPAGASAIRSLFIEWKGDQSWAEAEVEVDQDGRKFRAERTLRLWSSDWREEELRFPAYPADPAGRRAYLLLRDAGPDREGTPGVRVILTVRKSDPAGAWIAKALLNYRRAAEEVPLLRYFATSLCLVLLNVVLMIFACTLTGYAFARLEWPGRDFFFGILLATMMIPAQVTLIPNFLLIRQLGWFNTLLPLWVPALFGAPYFIFLVRQFLKNIPRDLEEAARIDGCGFLRIYWHVMLPLVKPTVASIAIFTFIGTWNNFMGPLIYLNDERLYPLALGLFRFNLGNSAEMGLLMAASFIMTIPVILIFFFLQRFFIRGLALSGINE